MDPKKFQNYADKIVKNCSRVIIGKDEVIRQIIVSFLCGGHVLLEDVPGTGKTMLFRAFSRTVGGDFRRIQFTPDLLPSDLTGINFYNQKNGEFEFRKGPLFSSMILADEINRATPRTQSALLESMEEHQVTVDGVTYPMAVPFMVMATQNPVGSAGTQMLPSAQMDRFMIKISMGYPDFESQISILRDRHRENPLDKIQPKVNIAELQQLIEEASAVQVMDCIYEYVTKLTQATRNHPMIALGVSPRGALAVCRMAKAYAYLHGRSFVVPEDVVAVFTDTCAHRLVLATKARMMEEKPETIIRSILESVKMPVIKK